jgi:hypothetical protein
MSALLHGDSLHGWFFEAMAGGTDAHAGRSHDRLPVGTSLFRNSLCGWGPGQQVNLSLTARSHHWVSSDSDCWQSPPQSPIRELYGPLRSAHEHYFPQAITPIQEELGSEAIRRR